MPYRLLLLSLSLLAWNVPAPALTIHRCTGSDGTVAFQDRPCGAHLQSRVVVLRAEPAAAAESTATAAAGNEQSRANRTRAATKGSAAWATKSAAHPRSRRKAATADGGGAVDSSWECRATNGEVFYQHGPCPAAVAGNVEQPTAATRGRRRSDAQTVPVAGRPIARAEACRRIHAASASDRAGHERDEDVTTYERNLGRDPCR